jgi:hydroxypyruvate isomerase
MDACAAQGVPNVIAFTGYKWRDADDPASGEISREEGGANTAKGLRELARYGETTGVTVVLEHLNTRDDSDPMKGHPGYQGDDIDYCADIVRQAGSPRAKLLFDVYHVAIMNGDVIRRLRRYRDLLGHIHVAGVPGRNELNDDQEISFPAVMRALVEIGYTGYVGLEFIPTRDAKESLAQAVALCDV